jgi:glycerophosphoryl diester phosphodiesterase
MRKPHLLYIASALSLLASACGTDHMAPPDVHGHRGCRALMPENTVAGFLKAAELGCTWMEMDVVLTSDGQVLVSHEPWMDHRICRTPQGDSITPEQERSFNIFRMTTAEAQAFDCGSAQHPDFPEQENAPAHKPTLQEVVEALDDYATENGFGTIGFNIELKSEPELYGSFQPAPEPFAKAVLAAIEDLNIADRLILQSFDPALLEVIHDAEPGIRLSLLVENSDGVETNLKRLSFMPAIYSPDFALLDAGVVETLHARDIEVAAWTVNEDADIRRVIALGVDVIITDRPDRVLLALDEGE